MGDLSAPAPEAWKRESWQRKRTTCRARPWPRSFGPAPAAMSSLPCPLSGRDASKAVFPDIAPVPSVVAAYPLGLSPATAAASDLPYSGPYGHLLPYPYTGPATPSDAYLPCQQPTAPSQPSLQEREAGKYSRRGFSHLGDSCSCAPLNFALAWLGAASGIQPLLRIHGIWGWGEGKWMGRETRGRGGSELI